MPQVSQDRLVRKEVMLGLVRERSFPTGHIILSQVAPLEAVESDDVIFQYVQEPAAGLAPARAEDAESELAGKEDTFGSGRASIIDWAIKDHYQPSDVSRYQDTVFLQGRLGDNIPVSFRGGIEAFRRRVARDAALRRKKLDNRLEWLGQQMLWTGGISYNDGKVIFTIDGERPAAQAGASNPATGAPVTPWSSTSADPIGDTLALKQYMRDTHGIEIDRGIASERVIRAILNSDRFAARSGLAANGGPSGASIDPNYVIDGWGVQAALSVFERQTGVTLQPYDSVFFTRTAGSTTKTLHRFSPSDKICFLPSQASVDALDDTIGFAKTLTSPHPEGNWTPGYYEWEKDTGPDPWGYDVGTGIKAFPVFPHLDWTCVLDVL
jgi:hypothetical protein